MATPRPVARQRPLEDVDTMPPSSHLTGRSGRRFRTQRQEAILDQLERLFLADGFRHLTLQDLTDELHCSRTILYALAPTKEELVLVVIDRWLQKVGVALNTAVDQARAPDERLEAALDGIGTSSLSATPRFMADMASYGPTNELHMKHARHAFRRLEDIITDGVTKGTFRQVDARFAAAVMHLVMTSISDGTLVERTGMFPGEATLEFKELLFRGVLHRVPARASRNGQES
jgi:AcrR family transcriptional regulator